MKPQWFRTLEDTLRQPTAPFREEAVAAFVRRFAEANGLKTRADAAGNLHVTVRRSRRRPDWIFTAHMDHPGFVIVAARGRRARAEFRGNVEPPRFAGKRIVIRTQQGPVRAAIGRVRRMPSTGFLDVALALPPGAAVRPGDIGRWDVPVFRRRGDAVSALACDDLAGVAAILCAMAERARRGGGRAAALLTRAEEAGFTGALEAARDARWARGANVVVLETSAERPGVRLGDGAVVRVGDAASIFDPDVTADLWAVARDLARRSPGFKAVRALMSGGTCEATVFRLAGRPAGALCVPLGNYHNRAARRRVAAERIHANDFASLVRLLIALASRRRPPAGASARLRRRLDRRHRVLRRLL